MRRLLVVSIVAFVSALAGAGLQAVAEFPSWAYGVTMPPPPRPADGVPGSGSGPESREVAGVDAAPDAADLERYAGRYERTSRRFDVSVRDGRLAMALTMTGNLAALVDAEPDVLEHGGLVRIAEAARQAFYADQGTMLHGPYSG